MKADDKHSFTLNGHSGGDGGSSGRETSGKRGCESSRDVVANILEKVLLVNGRLWLGGLTSLGSQQMTGRITLIWP